LPHSIRIRHVWELVQYMDHTNPSKHGHEMQTHFRLSCTHSKANMEKALSNDYEVCANDNTH
jgi:hypothetical protein